jgi:hypothetical protein
MIAPNKIAATVDVRMLDVLPIEGQPISNGIMVIFC